jgi:hypothetical protein
MALAVLNNAGYRCSPTLGETYAAIAMTPSIPARYRQHWLSRAKLTEQL